MATIQSTLSFQDQMSAKIEKITKTLEDASKATEMARQNMEDMTYAYGAGSKEAINATMVWAKNKSQMDSLASTLEKTKVEQDELARAEKQAALEATFASQKTKIFGFEIKNTKNETDKLSSGLKNTINNLSIFGISIGTIIGNFATRAIDSLRQTIGTAIETASDLAEVQNVVDVAFDSNADTINKWANTTLNAYGLNELSAKKYAGTMGAMLKSSGLTGDAVAEMAMKITELSGDMASFYNLSSEEAFSKIRAGISGETEPLKRLGINMSVANLEAYALSKGMQVSYNSMSQAAQMTLRYQYLLETTKDAQGDFTRTQGSFANQQKLAQENWLRLSSIIANMFIPALTAGYKIMNTVMNFLSDNMMTILPLLIATLGAVTIAFVAMKIEAIQAGLAAAQAGLEALAAWIAATAPLWIVIGVIALISAGLNALGLSFQEQAENILISFNWIITGLKNIWIAIQNVWTFAENAVKNFNDINTLILAKFFGWVASKLEGIAKLIDMVFKTNLSEAVNNFANQASKAEANLTKRIQGNVKGYKSFEANDLYTNQAKAQGFMGKLSGINTRDLFGKIGTGAGVGTGLEGLTTNTSGGRALKTQNQGDIGIKEEDMELLHDLATEKFAQYYQQLTPTLTIPNMVIHETADVNEVLGAITSSITGFVRSSTYNTDTGSQQILPA